MHRTQVLYQLSAEDSNGDVRHFEKPLFLTFVMFVAMACAIPIYCLQQVRKMYRHQPALQSIWVLELLSRAYTAVIPGSDVVDVGQSCAALRQKRCTASIIIVVAVLTVLAVPDEEDTVLLYYNTTPSFS